MDGNQILSFILLAIYIYGFYNGWKQLSMGNGFLCSHLPERALKWINQKKASSIVVKIILGFVLAYFLQLLLF